MDLSLPILPHADAPRSAEALPVAPFHADRQRALVSAWERHMEEAVLQAALAPSTVGLYKYATKVWLAYLGVARSDVPTARSLGSFLAALLPGRRPATANALLAGVRALYRWSASVDAWPDIGRPVRPVRVRRDGPLPALRHGEVGQLLALIVGTGLLAKRDRAILAVLYASGARGVSLQRADVRHFDAVGGTLAHQAKGRREADSLAYLPPHAAALLSEYLRARAQVAPIEADASLFATCDRRTWGARMGVRSIRNVVTTLLEKAGHRRRGLDGKLASPNTWGAHVLRRSALTTAADNHGLEAARALAGHASQETTRRCYVRCSMARELRAVAVCLDLVPSTL